MPILFWDITRIVTVFAALISVGFTVAVIQRGGPRLLAVRAAIFVAMSLTIATYDYFRLGAPPVLGWRLIVDLVLMVAAAVTAVLLWQGPPFESGPTAQDRDEVRRLP